MPRHIKKKVQFTGGLMLGHLYVVVCSLFYHDYALACFFSIFKFNFFPCNTMHRALKFASRKARGFFLLLMYLKMLITVQDENFTVFEALNFSCSLINCPCN